VCIDDGLRPGGRAETLDAPMQAAGDAQQKQLAFHATMRVRCEINLGSGERTRWHGMTRDEPAKIAATFSEAAQHGTG
jgi:hypothetical protein